MKKISKQLASKRAEGYVDSGVKILIAVVIGALLLGGLYALFGDTIMPTVSDKVTDLFDYSVAAASGGGSAAGGGVEYTMLEADEAAVDTKTTRFRSDAPITKFVSVSVDNAVIDASNYTVTEGSTIVNLKTNYVKTLEKGTHTLRITSADGYAETTFEKKNTISFTISEVGTFNAVEGMTWGEWILSYQMSSSSNGIVWVEDGTLDLYVDIGNGLWENQIKNQHYGDTLVNGTTYRVIGPT